MDIERNVAQASQDVTTFLSTGTYKVDPDAIVERVKAPKASWADFRRHFGQWKNFKVLFGAAYSWFALDVAFYGLGLNSSIVLTAIGFGSSSNSNKQVKAYQTLHNVSVGNLILSVGGLIPGYWATFLFVDHWGRKPIQLMGFTLLTSKSKDYGIECLAQCHELVIFVCMGFGYDKMVHGTAGAKKAFVFLYW
jgi:PHS family inorganic phosphate transporter-like MFS transporter